jgi:hypothetical protein
MSKNLQITQFKSRDPAIHGVFYVKLDKDRFGDFQELEHANNYYFLINGSMHATYAANNESLTISSPYGSGWSDYIDSPVYGQNVCVTLLNDSEFSWIKANTPSPLNIKVGKCFNETITTNANANSLLLIFGNEISYNGNTLVSTANTPYHRIEIEQNQPVTVSTSNSCICFMIEWI